MNFLRRLTIALSFFCILFLCVDGFSQQLNWAYKIGGTGNDNSNTVYTDHAGDVYIAGKFSGTNVDFDPSPTTSFLLSSAGPTDAFVAKYNAAGQFIWAFRYGGSNRDEANALAFDQSDNVYLTGYFRGSNIDFDPGPGIAALTSNGDNGAAPYGGDIVIAKYNAAGQYQWAFNIGGTELDNGICITTDPSGNVYAGGYFHGLSDFNPGAASNMLNPANGTFFLAKYSSAGTFQWAFNTGLANDDNSVFDLKTDNAGNLYATGYFQGTNIDFDPGPGVAALSSAGGFEIFVAKYTTDGQYGFAFRAGGSGLDVGRGIVLDNAGNIYLLGDFNGSNIDFDPSAGTALLSSNGGSDVFLAKYNNAGQYQWAFNFGGTGGDIGWKVATDNSHLFITGGFTGTADLNPSAGVDNLVSAGGNDIFLGKYTLNGEYLCSFKIGGTGDDYGYSIVSNAANSFYLSGSFQGTNIDFDPAATISNLSSAGSDDIFLGKYTWPDNTPPAGTLSGGTICTGEQAQLTFTATAGTGPFTIVYNNGNTDVTVANVQSGVPFAVTPNPSVTTTYTLVSVKDAQRCSETNFVSGVTAVVTVNTCTPPLTCNNWLNTPSQPSWVKIGDLDVSGNQLTIEALINIKGIAPGGNISGLDVVSKHTTFTDVNYLLRSDHAELSTTSGFFSTAIPCEIEMNKTYHVAMVYDGATLKYYRNGYLLGQTPATGNMIINDLPTAIGYASSLSWAENFIGYINEVRIWSVARTQDQIRTNMGTSLPNPTTQTGLKAYYTFDNLVNKQGNAAYNGTLQGSAAINQTNPNCTFTADSCYRAPDCSQWLNTPVQGSKFTAGDVDITGNQVTVEAVFNRTQPLNSGLYYGHLVSKHSDQTNVNYALLPNGCEITTSNGYKSTFQTCPLDLNKTYHVAMVYDGATLKYYQNGFLMSQVACTGTLVTNNLTTTIGQVAASVSPFNNQFLGYVNEVRIWNVARTQTQITTFMNASLPNPATQAGLKAYYTFDNVSNDQGNAAFNGTLAGGAAINQVNPNCTFTADSCQTAPPPAVVAGFTAPATVCVNTPITITNTSENATSYYWNFCVADPTVVPTAVNLGNPGNNLSAPVFSDIVSENGNYYVFVTNNWPGKLTRLDFGNSLLNTPTAVNLGNLGGVLVNTLEGIQVVRNEGKWYAIIVGGSLIGVGIPSRIIKVEFGPNITNPAPVATNWGNIGNLAYPIDLHLFQEGNAWYGLTVNSDNNTITRFNFTSSFANTPTGVNLGNPSGLFTYPTGIYAMSDNGQWHVFVTDGNNVTNSKLVRLDFGNSLLNTPTAVNLGNPGNLLQKPRDIYILKECGRINAFVVNEAGGTDKLIKLSFSGNILSTLTATSLGNIGNMSFPHSISQMFRAGNDLYTFVTNVDNNTITRIRFQGCSSSSIPNSSLQNPPPVTYNTPGTYNITLTIDDGLPTQATVCQQVVVTACTPPVTAGFTAPATVCVNTPVTLTNTSENATSYYWSFCAADPAIAPTGVNLGNPGTSLVSPVYSDMVKVNGNYYLFVVNHWPGGLVRLDFGNSYLNTPTAVSLGNVGGILPNALEGIQMVYNNGRWLALIVGGNAAISIPSRIIKIDFGANITNTSPVGTNWGNIGNLDLPHELHVFQENGIWYGLTVNAGNNTVTRFNFTNDLVNNTPTGVNLGSFGGLDYPTGINAVKDNGNWYVFITSDNDNPSLVRLDFGTSLLNTPVATNLGNPGGILRKTRDIYILKDCGQINAFAINGFGVNQLIKLNFGGSITSVPTATNLGNIGNMNFPHSISTLFRVGNDLYTFVPNNANNTITRIRFAGCSSSSIPNSALQAPAPVTYNTPGTYNITLTIDDGLPTQATVCQQVVVTDCPPVVINQYTEVLSFDICKNSLVVSDAANFNAGDTVLMIQMKGAVIDSTNTAAFGTVTDYKNAGNYEFNYIKSKTGNVIELLNVVKRQYNIPDGKVQLVRVPYFQNYTATSRLTCAPWDGSKGGVLAFNVQNSLTLNADIDVSGKGFRGGMAITNPQFTCNIDSFYSLINNGKNAARKGEGIFNTNTLLSGRGKLANGGGGGNSTNAGGAGGGNGGAGGAGGKQYIGCGNSNFVNGGVSGLSLPYSNAGNRIFLGGGGGAGQENDIPALGSGGNGGGIAIINCGSLGTNGFSVKADGETPVHVTGANEDGRSGGGAGGTILLSYTTSSGTIAASVKGGNGDYCTPPALDLHGPGGGGGGGIIWVNKPFLGSGFSVNLSGGMNGVNTNLSNNPWGALPGSRGDTLGNLVVPVADVPFKKNIDSVRIGKTAVSCSHFEFDGLGYVNAGPVASWQWYFGDGGEATTQHASHIFTGTGTYTVKLVITDINGCKDSISTALDITALDFDFNFGRNACSPMTVTFNGLGTSTGNTYWNFGDGNSATGATTTSHTYTATGNYTVKYSITNGVCTDTVAKTISVDLQQDNALILTADTTICYNTTKQLRTAPALDICWSPTAYLDNPNSPQPVTSAPNDITYYFTAQVTGNNLIINGNFTQGNTGFASGYTHSMPNTNEGQYLVGVNPSSWNGGMSNCGDHTTGTGNMMMVNGAPAADVNVWSQTVTVAPNTNYAFSTWIQALFAANPAQLQFSINGKNIGNLITASLPTCTWSQFYTTWNSGNGTSAVISIVNKNTQLAGNDFALDDISFAPVFIKRDSVKITVEKPLVTTNSDTTVCPKSPVQLITAGAQNYTWSPATGLTNPGIGNPIASPADTTRYIVTGTTVNGCVAKDTVYVNVFPKPAITTSDDATICKNTSAQLSVTGGISYSWFPAASLNNPAIANPLASPAAATMYYVTVTDVHNCGYLDSVQIAIRPDAVFSVTGAGPVCQNDSLQLHASGGNTYSWQPATGLSNAGIADPKTSPGGTTDYMVTIVETTCNQSATLPARVTVLPLPDVQASKSNDIDCSNDRVQLGASGADRYRWTPVASLNNSTISNPVAMPVSTTLYIVGGTNTAGCTSYDTVIVKVENINQGAYLMPNAFTPNNDGVNDCYGVKNWGIIQELEFSIYNRWGEKIFYTKNPNQCWDGTYKGATQDSGVFVYMIKAKTNCESAVFRKGTFVLIR